MIAVPGDHAWGEFLVEQGAVAAATYREANERYFQLYQSGALDIHEYLAFSLKPLAEISPEQLAAWHQQFMAAKI
ncbi:HAD-IB family hydrolase, partial [Cobetia marina]